MKRGKAPGAILTDPGPALNDKERQAEASMHLLSDCGYKVSSCLETVTMPSSVGGWAVCIS